MKKLIFGAFLCLAIAGSAMAQSTPVKSPAKQEQKVKKHHRHHRVHKPVTKVK